MFMRLMVMMRFGFGTGTKLGHIQIEGEELLLQHATWVGTDGSTGAQLDISDHDMRGTTLFMGARLGLMKADNCILYGINLSEAQMQAARLRNADMRQVMAHRADLRGADMGGRA